MWISAIATARPPSVIQTLGAEEFQPVVLAPASPEVATAPVAVTPLAVPSLAPILDFPIATHQPASRPNPALPNTAKAEVKAVPKKAAPKAVVGPAAGGSHRVSGTATWYCKTGVSVCHHAYSGGMYAAAGSELRIGNWRGRVVRVCKGGDCISVRLIDWCACGGARIIDLYSDAFRRLGPLSAGGLKVTVSW